jgi:hypothetical protein
MGYRSNCPRVVLIWSRCFLDYDFDSGFLFVLAYILSHPNLAKNFPFINMRQKTHYCRVETVDPPPLFEYQALGQSGIYGPDSYSKPQIRRQGNLTYQFHGLLCLCPTSSLTDMSRTRP